MCGACQTCHGGVEILPPWQRQDDEGWGAGAGLANLSAFPASHAERSEAYHRRTDGCLVGKACKGALCVPDVLRWRWHPS